VNVAVVERLAGPSRRCDAGLFLPEDDVVRVWDLSRVPADPPPSLGEMARAVATWIAPRGPPGPRWRAGRACFEMRGWPRKRAFVQAAGWMRQLNAGEIDEVACYSARHFPLARALAEVTGSPCREMLDHGTQYLGEFAFELLAVVPYAYWLHQRGRLEFTVSTADTRCLYYFSPNHVERSVERTYVPITEYPIGERGPTRFDRTSFPEVLDTSRWTPPPYREIYDDGRFQWAKPPLVVCNKTSDEDYLGDGPPVNHMDLELLLALVAKLRTRYTVIYNRPKSDDIVNDHSEIRDLGDIAAVTAAYPDVLTIQALHGEHPDLTFNELQLRLFASCERFVSVLGGSSYLASYFGGTNVVYAQRGWEVTCGAYDGWFRQFSGARVVAAATPDELLAAVEREFL
jgi:hypothetical protein